jgi:hypothetical protein
MSTAKPSSIERERALVWISRQLRWERTLRELRDGVTVEQPLAA